MHGYGSSSSGTSEGWRRAAICAALVAILTLGGCATVTVFETPLVVSSQSEQRQLLQEQADDAVAAAVAAGWADAPNATSLANILLNGMEQAGERDIVERYLATKPAQPRAALLAVRADVIAARSHTAALADATEALLQREQREPEPPGEELAALERTLITFKRGSTVFAAAEARLRAASREPAEARSVHLEIERLQAELDRLNTGVTRIVRGAEAPTAAGS